MENFLADHIPDDDADARDSGNPHGAWHME